MEKETKMPYTIAVTMEAEQDPARKVPAGQGADDRTKNRQRSKKEVLLPTKDKTGNPHRASKVSRASRVSKISKAAQKETTAGRRI